MSRRDRATAGVEEQIVGIKDRMRAQVGAAATLDPARRGP
jgi:hypothetical protein